MKTKLNISDISEVRWKEQGDFESDEYRIIYSGGTESQRRVTLVLDKEIRRKVGSIHQRSDRLMVVKMQAEPVDLVIFQVYMPISDQEDNEIEVLYGNVIFKINTETTKIKKYTKTKTTQKCNDYVKL